MGTVEAIETYRGVDIQNTADVLGFAPSFRDRVCVVFRFRRDDDAPIVDMFPTVEAARHWVDEAIEEGVLSPAATATGEPA